MNITTTEAFGEVIPLDGIIAIGYTRVSTIAQAADDRTSLADQRRAIEALAKKRGVAVQEWFSDPGASGASVEGRPGFRSLIASCRASSRPDSRPGFVFCLNDSRWGRFERLKEASYWRFELERHGWLVLFCEGDDIEHDLAREVVRLAGSGQANEYRQNIKANTKRGRRAAASQGYWTSGARFGYVRRVVMRAGVPLAEPRLLKNGVRGVTTGERKGSDERVKLWPDASGPAEFIRTLFERYAEGEFSTQGAAEWAHEQYPDRKWDASSVYELLTCRTYIGEVAYDGGVCEGAHPALVSPELFDRVQRRLRANARGPRKRDWFYVLSNLVTCEGCGLPLIGGGTSQGRHYYRCTGRCQPSTPCTGHGTLVSASRLEFTLLDTIAYETAQPAFQHALVGAVDRMVAAIESQRTPIRSDSIEAGLARLQKEEDRIIAMARRGSISDERADRELADIKIKRADLETDRRQVRRLSERRDRQPIDRNALYRAINNAPQLVRQATGKDARELARLWVEQASIRREGREKVVRLAIRPQFGLGVVSCDLVSQFAANDTSPISPLPVVVREVALRRGSR